jgi:hypothetical protein
VPTTVELYADYIKYPGACTQVSDWGRKKMRRTNFEFYIVRDKIYYLYVEPDVLYGSHRKTCTEKQQQQQQQQQQQ